MAEPPDVTDVMAERTPDFDDACARVASYETDVMQALPAEPHADADDEFRTEWQNIIADPLARVVGAALQSVTYFVLAHDYFDFDLNAPNASGACQGVVLAFDNGAQVELDWEWQTRIRDYGLQDHGLGYHLVARSVPLSKHSLTQGVDEAGEVYYNGLGALDATTATPWAAVHNETLFSATVWGFPLENHRAFPSAVSFVFPSGEVVVGVGHANYDPPTVDICDGDEILILDGKRGGSTAKRAASKNGRACRFRHNFGGVSCTSCFYALSDIK